MEREKIPFKITEPKTTNRVAKNNLLYRQSASSLFYIFRLQISRHTRHNPVMDPFWFAGDH